MEAGTSQFDFNVDESKSLQNLVLFHRFYDEKVPWHLRDFTYKMIKCGLIDDQFLDWGRPSIKGIDKIERDKELTIGKGGNGVKALIKGLGHDIKKHLKVEDYKINTIKQEPCVIDPEKIRRWQMRLIGRGSVNDEKLKPTTNQDLLDESNEHTKTTGK